jgi:hypothetical protein
MSAHIAAEECESEVQTYSRRDRSGPGFPTHWSKHRVVDTAGPVKGP